MSSALQLRVPGGGIVPEGAFLKASQVALVYVNNAHGLLRTVQQFQVNAGVPVVNDASYTVPVCNGAVTGFTLQVGSTVLEGHVRPLPEAVEAFCRSVESGSTAGLARQNETTGALTVNVGALPAGALVTITVHAVVSFDAGVSGFSYLPMHAGLGDGLLDVPVAKASTAPCTTALSSFVGWGAGSASGSASGSEEDHGAAFKLPPAFQTSAVAAPAADRVDVFVAMPGKATVSWSSSAAAGGAFARRAASDARSLWVSQLAPGANVVVRMHTGVDALEVRALVVDMEMVATGLPGPQAVHAGLMTVPVPVPRSGATKHGVAVTLVLDFSGSMVPARLQRQLQLFRGALQRLTVDDWFRVVAFATEAQFVVGPEFAACSPEAVAAAVQSVKARTAGGGTRLETAMAAALTLTARAPVATMVFVVITDCDLKAADAASVCDTVGPLASALESLDFRLVFALVSVGAEAAARALGGRISKHWGNAVYYEDSPDAAVSVDASLHILLEASKLPAVVDVQCSLVLATDESISVTDPAVPEWHRGFAAASAVAKTSLVIPGAALCLPLVLAGAANDLAGAHVEVAFTFAGLPERVTRRVSLRAWEGPAAGMCMPVATNMLLDAALQQLRQVRLRAKTPANVARVAEMHAGVVAVSVGAGILCSETAFVALPAAVPMPAPQAVVPAPMPVPVPMPAPMPVPAPVPVPARVASNGAGMRARGGLGVVSKGVVRDRHASDADDTIAGSDAKRVRSDCLPLVCVDAGLKLTPSAVRALFPTEDFLVVDFANADTVHEVLPLGLPKVVVVYTGEWFWWPLTLVAYRVQILLHLLRVCAIGGSSGTAETVSVPVIQAWLQALCKGYPASLVTLVLAVLPLYKDLMARDDMGFELFCKSLGKVPQSVIFFPTDVAEGMSLQKPETRVKDMLNYVSLAWHGWRTCRRGSVHIRPLFSCRAWQVHMLFETMNRLKDETAATWQFVDKFEFDVGGPVCIKASTA